MGHIISAIDIVSDIVRYYGLYLLLLACHRYGL